MNPPSKDLKTRMESVITISNGDLSAVVWRDKNGRLVLYKCDEMTTDEIMSLISKNEDLPDNK